MPNSQYRFPQEEPGVLGKFATKAGKGAISLFGEEFITDIFANGKLPQWYVRAMRESGLWVKCCYSGRTAMTGPLITAADRERGFVHEKDHRVGRALLADWAKATVLTEAEWNYLLDVLTNESWVSYNRGVIEDLADRSDINWNRLERIINIPDIKDTKSGLVYSMISKVLRRGDLDVQSNGALFQWALGHPDKEKYLDCFYGARLLEGAKVSIEPGKWQETVEWLIKLKPRGTLIGVLDLDGKYPGIVSRQDFLGIPKHIFLPWLTDKDIDRDLRVEAIQWLGQLGIKEAEEKISKSDSPMEKQKTVPVAKARRPDITERQAPKIRP